jgi:hypothetical protein
MEQIGLAFVFLYHAMSAMHRGAFFMPFSAVCFPATRLPMYNRA